jgi:hypothetical protein
MTLEQIKTSLMVIRGLNLAYKATKQEHYKLQAMRRLWALKGEIRRYNLDDKTLIMAA